MSMIAHIAAAVASGILTSGLVASSVGDGDVAGFPLDKLLGLGSGGVVTLVVWVFLKRDEQLRKEHTESVKAQAEITKAVAVEFSQTAKALGSEFSETTATMLREARTEAQQREERLAKLFETMTKDKP